MYTSADNIGTYRLRHRNQTQNPKGPLAPFNEELTFNFRGPLNLYNIAVYQPDSSGATWTQTSSWAAGQAPNNLVFMNNMGGGASGEWSSAYFLRLVSLSVGRRTACAD